MSDKIVEEHRKMIIVSGKISDFQLNNLKKYPFIILGDYLKEVKIDYNFNQPGSDFEETKIEKMFAGEITFTFNFVSEPSKEELSVHLGQLASWVKYLFWTNTEVKFIKDGKQWVM